MNRRPRTIKQLVKLYNLFSIKNSVPCAYCGMPATDMEHVIPISWICDLQEMQRTGMDVDVPEIIIVPACRECNLIASNKIFKNFAKKRQHICTALWKKYNRQLNRPDWDEEEIEQLGDRLREVVYFGNEALKIKKARLKRIKKYVDFESL